MAYIHILPLYYNSGLSPCTIDFYESETGQLIVIQYSESVARFLRRLNPIALNMMVDKISIFPKAG
ncbi:hypothetical protein RhiirA5_441882 [Rhizophagus irregularis]|uniref:Uncharacterized protein n=1 Tax=Rhizophagus irregularis TaxID=588596 RepID=A0A2N0NF89_9GLOM|nr:hypothetical protein RhiirA5_441882 [Rhizophagus irregularis]